MQRYPEAGKVQNDPEGQGYPGKASGTLEQHTKAWESRDCWETAQNKAHTRSDQADLRGKGLESTLGLKVQRWTVRQDELNQPLILVGLEPGLTSLLSTWPPMLEHWCQGSHCSRMGTAEPPTLEYGRLRYMDACERAC